MTIGLWSLSDLEIAFVLGLKCFCSCACCLTACTTFLLLVCVFAFLLKARKALTMQARNVDIRRTGRILLGFENCPSHRSRFRTSVSVAFLFGSRHPVFSLWVPEHCCR